MLSASAFLPVILPFTRIPMLYFGAGWQISKIIAETHANAYRAYWRTYAALAAHQNE